MRVEGVRPALALPGGTIQVTVTGLEGPEGLQCFVGGAYAQIISASSRRVIVKVPQGEGQGLTLSRGDDRADAELTVGHVLASGLHPVANPVIDSSGSVLVTYSGARGEEVPYGVFRVSPSGDSEPFLGDIVNPTGLAIGPDRRLYISSRHTGAVYRSTFDKQLEKFAEGLGLATGLAFDSTGNLFVGDRSGIVYRLDEQGKARSFCELEPSVAAYHLAFDSADRLFVTGPTLATQDSVYVISSEGAVDIFFRGLGRPQGLFFDPQSRLHVAACWRGQKGVFRFDGDQPELVLAAPMLVGGAWDPGGSVLYLVDSENLFQIPT